MNSKELLILIFIIFLLYFFIKEDQSEHFKQLDESDGFDLKNVDTMTFFRGLKTTGGRTSPIPQLKCVKGDACNRSHLIDTIQCKNSGTNEQDDVQWACQTYLPNNLGLGETNISCEGLKDSKDKIKLKGSCGLEYSLNTLNQTALYDDVYEYYRIFCAVLLIVLFVFLIVVAINSRPIGGYGYPYSPYLYYSPPLFVSGPSYSSSFESSFRNSPSFSSSIGFGTTNTR